MTADQMRAEAVGSVKIRHRLKWLLMHMHWLPDALYLRWAYRLETGHKLDTRSPTFNARLHVLKLRDSGRDKARYVDKIEARKAVSEALGPQYLVPLLGVYDTLAEVPWRELPEQCAIKCTHGSHCGVIRAGPWSFDQAAQIYQQFQRWMRRSWFWYARERPYAWIRPRIMVEQRIIEDGRAPTGYKVMCFGGVPRVVQMHTSHTGKPTIDLYDTQGKALGIGKVGYARSGVKALDHAMVGRLCRVAGALARAIGSPPYVRVDLYCVDGRVLFGEFTFYDSGGLREFTPASSNTWLGRMITIRR